ncbi:MAG TPA: FG-GAP-like repeat-containing protein [Lacipirellulaceae bacterium]|nr:FG-GAP-like repeat-containing protein [Lacipirellulaceae bacterium]
MRSSLQGLVGVMGALVAVSIFAVASSRAAFTDQSTAILGGANYITRSASLADYDGDGDLDLMFQTSVGPKLYQNNLVSTGTPSMTYTDVTSTMLPGGMTSAMWSAAWGDYNGDGKVDVFVGGAVGTGTLLKNNGPTTPFTNANDEVGLNTAFFKNTGYSQNVAWGDFNNDHRLDLVIGMEVPSNQMYLQQANGKFTESGAAVGIQTPVASKSYGLAIGDYDGDGDLDLFMSTCNDDLNDNVANALYKNNLKQTGTLTFTDVAGATGTQNTKNTYGAQFVDMDNDGKLDLVVIGAQNDTTGVANPTKIYRNNGNGTFTDVDTITGHSLLSSGAVDPNGLKLVDYDNDGDLDLYYHDNLGSPNQRLFRNDGHWNFTDVTSSLGLAGTAANGNPNTGAGGYDSVWGDIDHDGDQDLIDTNNQVLNNKATPEKVYLNDASTNGNHWLYVKLKGPSGNTTGIGASIYATMNLGTPDQVTLRRESNTDADTFNQSDLPVHFGMALSTVADWLRIVWPDGTVQFMHDVAADQYLTVDYADALPGDFNSDGKVDMADYVVWRTYLGSVFTQDDYTTWREYFGKSLSAGLGSGSAVPEPGTIILMSIGSLAMLSLRRR